MILSILSKDIASSQHEILSLSCWGIAAHLPKFTQTGFTFEGKLLA